MKLSEITSDNLLEAPQFTAGTSAYSRTATQMPPAGAYSAQSVAASAKTVNTPSSANAKPTGYRDTQMRGYSSGSTQQQQQPQSDLQQKGSSFKGKMKGLASKAAELIDPERDPRKPLGKVRSFAAGFKAAGEMGPITALRTGLAMAGGRLPSYLDPTKFTNKEEINELIKLLEKLPPQERDKILGLDELKLANEPKEKKKLGRPPKNANQPPAQPGIQPGRSKPNPPQQSPQPSTNPQAATAASQQPPATPTP